MKKLVLFIHGLGGDAEGTWKIFPELIRADSKVAALYDVKTFEYKTGLFGSQSPLALVAAELKTEIDNRYKDYSDIALIAHSQGGLIARSYIAERINSSQPLRVSRLLTFATPHHGSGHATFFRRMLFSSQQVNDLDPNSEFLRALGIAWGQAKAERYVRTKYVVAAGDAIVGQVSAMGQWSPDYEVISSVGHIASVKPESAYDTGFLICKKFLLEERLLPGGVEADYRAPLLRLNYIEANETTRFIYSARVLDFFGREAEEHILADFLGHPEQPFRWMVLHGSGGVGKSRLALELCLAARNEWHAGFLPQEGDAPAWSRWQPLMPTLIVVDYAARDTERSGRLLRALTGRGPADGTPRLAAPVRVLLIERTGEGDWLDKTVGVGTAKAQVNAARAPKLPLEAISDPWPIFEFVLNQARKPLPDKTQTLAALGEIDSERRPLFAYFMADAIAAGHDVRHFDAARLLDQVIERGREKYWKPAGATAEDERLLTVATMAGGLAVSAVKGVKDELLPSWDVDHHPAAFLAMTGRESGDNIAPLEPDIVGEHFTLSCLARSNLSNEYRARLCGLAWRLNPRGMAQFMLRAHRDLPDHAMLRWMRKLPPSEGVPQFLWAMASVGLMVDLGSREPDAARALLADMRGMAEVRGDAVLWEQWAKAAFNLMDGLRSRDPDAAGALLADMRGAAEAHGEATLWERWAEGATNLMNDVRSRDPDAAGALLAEVRGVAEARGEAALWKEWAKAATNLMGELGSRDPNAARALLAGMRGVAEARGEAALWREWAKAAFNLIDGLRSRDSDAAGALLAEVRGVAEARGEAALWEVWASAAFNLMIDFGPRDPDAARALLAGMHGVAEARGEAALWEEWAKAATNLMVELGSRDSDAARATLADMRRVAETRGAAALWKWWASAATNLMGDLRSRDPDAARTLLDDVRGVAEARGEAAMWEEWAKAAFNLMNNLRSRDLDAARALATDMRGVAEMRGEAALWEWWAKAAFNLVDDLRSRDPDTARALAADMRGVAQARGEAALWEWWAKAAFNLMVDLRSRDLDAARALAADMRGVAEVRGEPALWELWAKAATNLMADLRSRDLDAARALAADMRGVAQERGEAALWEEWAKAAFNLMADLRSRDLDAARALAADMRGVAQARGEPALWEPWAKAATSLMIDLGPRDVDAARALAADMRGVAEARGEAALWEWWAKAAFNLMNDLGPRDPDAARAFIEGLSPDDLKWLKLVIEQGSGRAPQS